MTKSLRCHMDFFSCHRLTRLPALQLTELLLQPLLQLVDLCWQHLLRRPGILQPALQVSDYCCLCRKTCSPFKRRSLKSHQHAHSSRRVATKQMTAFTHVLAAAALQSGFRFDGDQVLQWYLCIGRMASMTGLIPMQAEQFASSCPHPSQCVLLC